MKVIIYQHITNIYNSYKIPKCSKKRQTNLKANYLKYKELISLSKLINL